MKIFCKVLLLKDFGPEVIGNVVQEQFCCRVCIKSMKVNSYCLSFLPTRGTFFILFPFIVSMVPFLK